MSTSVYKRELEEFKAKVLKESIAYIDNGYDPGCIKEFLDSVGLDITSESVKITIEIKGFDKLAYSSDYGYDYNQKIESIIVEELDEIASYSSVFKVNVD